MLTIDYETEPYGQLMIQDYEAVQPANTDRQVALKRAHAVVARLKNGDVPTITPV